MQINIPRFGKTYIGGLGILCAAYLKYTEGDVYGALTLGAEALAVVGIGHKIEKQNDAK